ncbi:MAG: hypothetical protein R2873_05155 [Caldilineaceae bacterium]
MSPKTPEALAARILHLLTDEAHRRQLGDQAQVRAWVRLAAYRGSDAGGVPEGTG